MEVVIRIADVDDWNQVSRDELLMVLCEEGADALWTHYGLKVDVEEIK